MDPVIDIRGLSRSFGAVRAVEGVQLSVQKGEMFGIVGPDGAGKTTPFSSGTTSSGRRI